MTYTLPIVAATIEQVADEEGNEHHGIRGEGHGLKALQLLGHREREGSQRKSPISLQRPIPHQEKDGHEEPQREDHPDKKRNDGSPSDGAQVVLAPDDDGDQQEVDGRDQREDTHKKPDEEADAWLVRILIRAEAQEQDEELEDKCPRREDTHRGRRREERHHEEHQQWALHTLDEQEVFPDIDSEGREARQHQEPSQTIGPRRRYGK